MNTRCTYSGCYFTRRNRFYGAVTFFLLFTDSLHRWKNAVAPVGGGTASSFLFPYHDHSHSFIHCHHTPIKVHTKMEEAKEEHPHLVEYLEERLPQLGLDSDTYGAYVVGVVPTTTTTTTSTTATTDELEEIMELLKASIEDESIAEDESMWIDLIENIQIQMKLDQEQRHQHHQEERQKQKDAMQAKLEQAKLEQEEEEQKVAAVAATAKSSSSSNNQMDEASKKAMLARFAYEDDGQDDEDGEGNNNDDEAPSINLNKQAAAQAVIDKAKELRSKKVQTKTEEQQKTKEMKANKQQLKEERRKRAQKVERKR